MTFSAVIVGGGKGLRLGQEKSTMIVAGHPLIAYTLWAFENSPLVDEIVLVLPEKEVHGARRKFVRKYFFQKVKKVVPGGKRRQDSVRNGVLATTASTDFVLIHDGARPFLSQKVIRNVVRGLKKSPAAVPVLPLRDSLRQITRGGNFSVDRTDYGLAQTPQGFHKKMYLMVLKKSPKKTDFSDDASLFDAAGIPVTLVDGERKNFKITWKEDLEMGTTWFNRLSKKLTALLKK